MSSLIQDLISANSIPFYIDFRSGTLLDLSGNDNDGTPTGIELSNGAQFVTSSSVVDCGDSAELQLTEGTLIALVDYNTNTTAQLIYKRDAGGTNYQFATYTGNMFFYDGGSSLTLATTISEAQYLAVNFSNGETPEGYIDGLSVGSFSGAATITMDDAPLLLGNGFAGGQPFSEIYKAALIVNRKLTATEHSVIYGELSNQQFPTISTFKSYRPLVTSPSTNNLTGGYNCKIDGQSIVDLKAAGNDLTVNGNIVETSGILGPELVYPASGTAYAVDGGGFQALTDTTVSFWFSSSDVTTQQYLFNYYVGASDAWGVDISGGNIRIQDDIDNAGATLYSTAIVEDKKHHVVAVMSSLENLLYVDGQLVGSGISSTDDWSSFSGLFYLGSQNTSANIFRGTIHGKVEVYGEAKAAAWVLDQYEAGAKAVEYGTHWGVNESMAVEGGTIGDYLSDTGFQFVDGTTRWRVGSGLKIGGEFAKSIYPTVGGYLSKRIETMGITPEESLYGSWYGTFYKNGAGDECNIVLGSSATGATFNGYYVQADSSERLRLYERTGAAASTVLGTASATLSLQTWYEVFVSRAFDGEFRLYYREIGSGSWTEVGTGATDTTHTSATFVQVGASANSRIGWSNLAGQYGLVKYQGVIVPS